jgi:hypothetical protein
MELERQRSAAKEEIATAKTHSQKQPKDARIGYCAKARSIGN